MAYVEPIIDEVHEEHLLKIASQFGPSDVKTFDNVFSDHEITSISAFLDRPRWRYGHVSSTRNYTNCPPFWSMDLTDEKFFTEYLFGKIQETVGDELEVYRCYCNGQVYGVGGQPHRDGFDERARTFIFYANDSWDIRWNGKTCILLDQGPYYVLPGINRAVYFPGVVRHFAEETTRTYGGMRKTVVWKAVLK